MTNPKCENCVFWTARKARQTRLEEWEADTRPERPKGFLGALRWLWDPNQFKPPHPYSEEWLGDYTRAIDEGIAEGNRMNGYCSRFPEVAETSRDYGCGEFKPRLGLRD